MGLLFVFCFSLSFLPRLKAFLNLASLTSGFITFPKSFKVLRQLLIKNSSLILILILI